MARPDSASELTQAASRVQEVLREVSKAFIGSSEAVELLAITLLARGHALIEGVPGVAKTTLAKSFASALGMSFRRIQFTPDLLPSDITGTFVFDIKHNAFTLRRGPIFAQVVLADEINRAPAKTQSALLEAMQERQVTIEGETHPLEPPFCVLATQNPIEHEGTYPLPEAEMDRFMTRIVLGYPSPRDELRVLEQYGQPPPPVKQIITAPEIIELQNLAEKVHTEREIHDYVLAIVHRTREHPRVALGASPRAALHLVWASRGRALLHGRSYVLPDDVKTLAQAVLPHRILLGPDAELDGAAPSNIIAEILGDAPVFQRR